MTRSELSNIYQQIKHSGRILNSEEKNQLIHLIGEEYDANNQLFSISLLCLSLGSNYIEEHPEFYNKFLSAKIDDDDLCEIFRAIQYNGLMNLYLDSFFNFCTLTKYLDQYELSSLEAINAIGGHVYSAKDIKVYNYLLKLYSQAIFCYHKETNEEMKSMILIYISSCYKALLFSMFGKESRGFDYEKTDIFEK